MSDLTRRQLFRKLLPDTQDNDDRAAAHELAPQRRPPGALSERDFLSTCTRCGKCAEACPESAIFAFAEGTGVLARTPVLLPEQRPCTMCAGFPCTHACEDGALRPFDGRTWRLGRVQIRTEHCLAHQGPECGACVGLCPNEIIGITLTAWKPQVTDACIGCARCIPACPTSPPAIELPPL